MPSTYKVSNPRAAQRRNMLLAVVVGGVLLVAGLGAVMLLATKGQDLRQQAAVNHAPGCITNANCSAGFVCSNNLCLVPTPIPTTATKVTNGARCKNPGARHCQMENSDDFSIMPGVEESAALVYKCTNNVWTVFKVCAYCAGPADCNSDGSIPTPIPSAVPTVQTRRGIK